MNNKFIILLIVVHTRVNLSLNKDPKDVPDLRNLVVRVMEHSGVVGFSLVRAAKARHSGECARPMVKPYC